MTRMVISEYSLSPTFIDDSGPPTERCDLCGKDCVDNNYGTWMGGPVGYATDDEGQDLFGHVACIATAGLVATPSDVDAPPPPTCGYVADHPVGPHPGCAEFDGGATFTVTCDAPATHAVEVTDEVVDPRFRDDTLLLCDEHHSDLLHDVATGATTVAIRSDGPVGPQHWGN